MIGDRHAETLGCETIQAGLRRARRRQAELGRHQFGPVLGRSTVHGVFAATQRLDGTDVVGTDIAQAVAERHLRAEFDLGGLIAGTAAAAACQCGRCNQCQSEFELTH